MEVVTVMYIAQWVFHVRLVWRWLQLCILHSGCFLFAWYGSGYSCVYCTVGVSCSLDMEVVTVVYIAQWAFLVRLVWRWLQLCILHSGPFLFAWYGGGYSRVYCTVGLSCSLGIEVVTVVYIAQWVFVVRLVWKWLQLCTLHSGSVFIVWINVLFLLALSQMVEVSGYPLHHVITLITFADNVMKSDRDATVWGFLFMDLLRRQTNRWPFTVNRYF